MAPACVYRLFFPPALGLAHNESLLVQCAPAAKRCRTILTSLADPPSPSAEDSPSHDERPPLTSELSGPDPSCHGCGLALGYGKSVTVPRSGHSFHQRCFTCAACSGTFGEEKGARGFVESEGLPYHEKVRFTRSLSSETTN